MTTIRKIIIEPTAAQAPQDSQIEQQPWYDAAEEAEARAKVQAEKDRASHSPLPWSQVSTTTAGGEALVFSKHEAIASVGKQLDAAFIVRACNEYETLRSDHEKLSKLIAQEITKRLKAAAHAQRLADALKDCETLDGATAFVHPKYAPQRLRAINELVREALAQWEGAK